MHFACEMVKSMETRVEGYNIKAICLGIKLLRGGGVMVNVLNVTGSRTPGRQPCISMRSYWVNGGWRTTKVPRVNNGQRATDHQLSTPDCRCNVARCSLLLLCPLSPWIVSP